MDIHEKTLDPEFWKGKRVLLTGHTGFKGTWLGLWLTKLGASCQGISLPPTENQKLYIETRSHQLIPSDYLNILDFAGVYRIMEKWKPEVVFHLAAQSLVLTSYKNPLETFAVNSQGTANLLEAIRLVGGVRAAVMVTTDKVYENREWVYPYRETDPLGGHDPYSSSKAAAEIFVQSYRKSFLAKQGCAVATARAGNVIGGGDWAENRIIPDAVRAWHEGLPLQVRRPDSIRPWQHVLEPLFAYLKLAESMWKQPELAGPWNFGPGLADTCTVQKIIEMSRLYWETPLVDYLSAQPELHEAGILALDTSKARTVLGIVPRWDIKETIGKTMSWYADFYRQKPAYALCMEQITEYELTSF